MIAQKASVVITTYNGATRGFLRAAIDSVIAQTVQDFELILVDDGSSDSTGEICRGYLADSRIRYVRQENRGVAAARNLGISMASHPYVCFLDDDDLWKPEKLERQLKAFGQGGENVGLIYTAVEILDAGGAVIGLQRHSVPADPYFRLFYENFVDATSSVMVRRDVVERVGAFRANIYGPDLQGCEDRDLWIRIARKHQIVALADVLVTYRLHGQKLSRNLEQMERSESTMLALALADAPASVLAEQDAIRANALRRVAMEYFGIGEYRLFRNRVSRLAELHSPGLSLRVRYAMSLLPGLVKLARSITLPVRRLTKVLRNAD